MSLKVVATPIGNPGDITLRAIETLRSADLVIGEEFKEVSKLLKHLDIKGKPLRNLNEHSSDEDVDLLAKECAAVNAVLVSDCGTPGFCDPGARLVARCRKLSVPVTALPGASSLMCALALVSENVREFVFAGFIPAENIARAEALRKLKNESRAIVLMDTPYRLKKLAAEVAQTFGERKVLVGLDMTQETENIYEAPAKDIAALIGDRKAEFVLIVMPPVGQSTQATHSRNR